MNVHKALTVTGLALALAMIGPPAFAQAQSWDPTEASYSNNPDNSGSNQDAQQPSNMYFNSANAQPSISSMDRHVRNDISQASDQGIDVSDASYFEQIGREALQNGNLKDAMIDFTVADECLGPYGSMVQTAVNQGNFPLNQRMQAKDLERTVIRDTNRALANNANVHEAMVFENRGLQALDNNDPAKALKEFRGAETALGPFASLGSGSANLAENSSPAQFSENGGSDQAQWGRAQQVRSDIDQAQDKGYRVNDAYHYEALGREAMQHGEPDEASHYFDQSENALQQAGFQAAQAANSGAIASSSGWNGSNAWNGNSTGNGTGQNQSVWDQAGQVRHDIDQAQAQGRNVNNAFYLEGQGRLALEKGNQAKAQQDFNRAEQMLSDAGYQRSGGNQQVYNQG